MFLMKVVLNKQNLQLNLCHLILTATIDMEVNGEEDVEKATELIESAPTNGAKLVVDCEVNNKEEFDELMQAQSTANLKEQM